ncbi:MAG: zf-HC2 domain-containing protein [Anaerolineaceae bacterium]|nr:zf-HC2 domain-containing protein [Anaerolineaceae bacterium]
MHEPHGCEKMIESLSEYIDGNLRKEFCADLEKHLSECERCSVVLNTMQKTVEIYHEIPKAQALPDDIKKRLFLRLDLDDYLEKR